MYDVNAVLQAQTTKAGTPRHGMHARFNISAYSSASTAGAVFTPSIEHSDDNTTFTALVSGDPITAATAAAAKVVIIPFATKKRYIRSVMTLTTSSGVPSIAYMAELGLGFPN
jgi:hypothetical protein